jgi:rubrerythrin
VAKIDEAAYAIRDDAAAKQLAAEVRRKETAHLRLFEELCQSYPPAGARRRGAVRQAGRNGVAVAGRSSSKTTRRAPARPERKPRVAASLAS